MTVPHVRTFVRKFDPYFISTFIVKKLTTRAKRVHDRRYLNGIIKCLCALNRAISSFWRAARVRWRNGKHVYDTIRMRSIRFRESVSVAVGEKIWRKLCGRNENDSWNVIAVPISLALIDDTPDINVLGESSPPFNAKITVNKWTFFSLNEIETLSLIFSRSLEFLGIDER